MTVKNLRKALKLMPDNAMVVVCDCSPGVHMRVCSVDYGTARLMDLSDDQYEFVPEVIGKIANGQKAVRIL